MAPAFFSCIVCYPYFIFLNLCFYVLLFIRSFGCIQGFFSGKRGAGTHKRGKDKHTESFVTILLYNITSLPTFANFITIV
jgi:hypothetical protein